MGRSLNLWLGLLVLVCGVSFWLANGGTLPTGTTAPAGEIQDGQTTPAVRVADPVHLLVLNGTEVSGLARELALQVTRLGCVVEGVGNAVNPDTPVSILVNRRLPDEAARQLSRQLGGLPVVRQWDERVTEDVVLVLGRDWARVRESLQP